jgi:paraquat-inducible protein A
MKDLKECRKILKDGVRKVWLYPLVSTRLVVLISPTSLKVSAGHGIQRQTCYRLSIVIPNSKAAKAHPSLVRRALFLLAVVIYAGVATYSSRQIILHTKASTNAIEQILLHYNMKNEGAKALESFDKEHPFLGMFAAPTIKKQMELPSPAQASEALSEDVAHYLKLVREESHIAAWWSCFLLNLSVVLVIGVVIGSGGFLTRATLFALTTVSVFCFVIGVLAPAMVIWTAPTIPMATGNLTFVLQHQVRGIAAIIWELLTTSHWIVGGFLLLFSIITPLTKASLTFWVTLSPSKELNTKIGKILHSIGKWSMADVFVAAILLALYALKAQEATKSVPCLGLYYFTGYCMLSMSTTQLLTHSGLVAGNREASGKGLRLGVIAALAAFVLCFAAGSCAYTYQQYTENIKEHVNASTSPQKLNNADLVLPVHKSH